MKRSILARIGRFVFRLCRAGHHVGSTKPTMQVDIGAPGRAEGVIFLGRGLAADRAWFAAAGVGSTLRGGRTNGSIGHGFDHPSWTG